MLTSDPEQPVCPVYHSVPRVTGVPCKSSKSWVISHFPQHFQAIAPAVPAFYELKAGMPVTFQLHK